MSLKKLKRMQAAGKLPEIPGADLHESVQNNLEVAKEQIERSRQITSDSREIVERVRQALAQSERIRMGMLMQYPRNPMIVGKDYHEE